MLRPSLKPAWGSESISVAAPELWKNIPFAIKNANTLAQFKRLLKTYLFQHPTGANEFLHEQTVLSKSNSLNITLFTFKILFLRVRTVAKRHMRSPMFTASFILVSCVKLP